MARMVIPGNLVTVGQVQKTFGFKGQLKISLQSDSYSKLLRKGEFVFVIREGKGVPYAVEEFNKSNLTVKFHGIENADDAGEMERCEIAFPDQKAAEANDLMQLVNFTFSDKSSGKKGTITNVENYPQGPMLSVSMEDESYLIPLVEEFILNLDPRKKHLSLELPDEFFESFSE